VLDSASGLTWEDAGIDQTYAMPETDADPFNFVLHKN